MRASTVVASLAALCVLGSPALSAAAAPADLTGLEYVALGDSYSAGYGLPDPSDEPAPGCFQSPDNFPHQVAAALGLQLDDRSCSGAVTENITDQAQTTDTGGVAPVQSESLSASTDIVTVMISGNDLGFFGIAESCIAKSPTGPVFGVAPNFFSTNSCQAIYNPSPGNDFLVDVIDQEVKPALATTFALIKQKAPNAKVFVVGYPTITPPANPCFSLPYEGSDIAPPFVPNSVPFVAGDEAYLHHVEDQLDLAIQQAAGSAGFSYVPTFAQTQDHSLCTADPYVFGFTLTSTVTPDPVPGYPGVYIALGTLHPNQSGADFLAAVVQAAIVAAYPPALPATGAPITWWILAPVLFLIGLALTLGQRRSGSRPGPA
jgi:lysophospholipase L1-like esterase